MKNNNSKTRAKRNLIYKLLAFGFAAFLFVMPTNLNALPDTDLRAIASTLGIELGENGVTAYSSVILPQTDASSTKVAKGDGYSLAEAVKAMEVDVGRKIELGQCELIVIGEKFAKSGNYAPLEYLLSCGIVGAEAAIVYAPNVEDFINGANKIESNTVTGLNSFVIYSRDTIYSPSITLLDMLSALKSKSKAVYAPQIKIVESGEKDAKIESVNTAIALNYDSDFAVLDKFVTKGITWLDRFSDKGLLQLENFEYKDLLVKAVPADLKYKKTSINAKFIDGVPTITIKVKTHLSLKNGNFLSSKTLTPKEICDELSKQFSKKIENEIQDSINFARFSNIDFLQITEEFNRVAPKELKNYKGNLLQDLKIKYKIYSRVK